MYELIRKYWAERIEKLKAELTKAKDEEDRLYLRRQIAWMEETIAAVVVSEEPGEVDKFRKWDLDITVHRRLMKEGFELADGRRIPVDEAYKKDEHRFRIAIVCAMWLTGFDVPSLSTLYLDKPLKAHTLMQAIARANRVNEGKNNGLIVDYCGILKNLRKALATFAAGPTGGGGEDPARPDEELLEDLAEAIRFVRTFLSDGGFELKTILEKTGFARNAAIVAAKEVVNENDETRKRFEVLAREVFKKFKACLTVKGINAYRHDYDAINIIYKSLQDDREHADIAEIIRQLHGVVDEAITPTTTAGEANPRKPYDISKIDFDRLRAEFERSKGKRTIVQNLKQVVEERLARLIAQNPLRTDFQKHFEKIVDEYNKEKDRATIEKSFEDLLAFMGGLDEESTRAMREDLDEETLALFDLLRKPNLDKKNIARIKKVAGELLATLKAEKLRIDNWQEKEATRDAVRVAINDFLWNDKTGLPVETYSELDVQEKAEDVFRHVWRAYPRIPSPLYAVQ
jgi:type I restriction enzyme R subunit